MLAICNALDKNDDRWVGSISLQLLVHFMRTLFSIAICFALCGATSSTCLADLVTFTQSDEATGVVYARTQGDNWRNTYSGNNFETPDLFGSAATNDATGSALFNLTASNGFITSHRLDWEVGIMDGVVGPGNINPTKDDFKALAYEGGSNKVVYNANMQGSAPNNILSVDGINTVLDSTYNSDSNDGVEALKLDFSNSEHNIDNFGFWIGDLESRASGGTVGGILVYDRNGNLMTNGSYDILYSGDVDGVSNAYDPNDTSGSNNNGLRQWGNNTASFVSITSTGSLGIGEIYIFVGDDDINSSNTGNTEHLSISGLTFSSDAHVPEPASISAIGMIALFGGYGYRRRKKKSQELDSQESPSQE